MSLVIDRLPFDLHNLLAPVQHDLPAGFFDAEDPAYQGIDQELIKLGGLHAGSIDWAYVDEASRVYLAEQCKHWRIVGHLLVATLRMPSWDAWVDAAELIAAFAVRYGEDGYPKPGLTGFPAKRKLLGTWLDRLGESLGSLDVVSFAISHQDRARDALDKLGRVVPGIAPDEARLAQLHTLLNRHAEQARSPGMVAKRSTHAASTQAISAEFFSTTTTLPLGNERETRRTLLTLADTINRQDAYDPTGYLLRRFALWAHITAPPATKHDNHTELAGAPIDMVESYEEALAANRVDPMLLQRVERSVAAAPFWLQGSHLAARMAGQLAMAGVPEAIRGATQRFAQRLPSLLDLAFIDGRPFADAATCRWLTAADVVAPLPAAGGEVMNLHAELGESLEGAGIEAVLRRLQDAQTGPEVPRQRGYATVMAADALAARGLTWLADDLYAHVERQMRHVSAAEWEPALIEHLRQRVPSPRLALSKS